MQLLKEKKKKEDKWSSISETKNGKKTVRDGVKLKLKEKWKCKLNTRMKEKNVRDNYVRFEIIKLKWI